MAFTNYIQQIKGTNNTTYDLVDSSASHFVKGTQTSATNVWTGALPDGVTAYYDGLSIDYFLPYAGTSTAATLNLGSKGAKPVYVGNGTDGVTTHFPQYSVLHLTYIVNSSLNSGNGCWKVTGYYNTNTTYSAGTGLSLSSTTFNHSNSITAQTTQGLYPIKIDAQGHITAYGSAQTIPTTASEVGAAASSHTHGNITSGGDITATAPTIASGDQIIINDDSASKVTNGPTFDGSTTTKALTPKGTWETFSNSLLYGTCSTAAGTVAKEVTVDSSFKLETGATVAVKFSNSNTASSPTLNVNSTGAKSIKRYGTTAPNTSAKTSWQAGSVISLVYDGSYWQMCNWLNDDTNTQVTQNHSTSNTNYNMALSFTTGTSSGTSTLHHSNKIKGNPSTGRVTTEDLSDSDIDALINDLDVTGTYGSVEVKKLLWTNPSPTSAFAAQKINLNLAAYDVVEIHAYAALGTNYSQIVSSSADVGTTGTFIGIKPVEKASTDTTTIMQRSFEVADDGVTFTGGIYRLYSATTIGTAPDVYIPYKIYGIKNNFNVGSISVVDNIVEQGTSGHWHYRKWDSGIGECWLPAWNPGTYTCGTARGSLYSGANLTLTYPITFISIPTVTGNISLGTDAYVVWLQFNGLGATTAQCRIVSSGSIASNSNYLISVYVIGKWK